MAGARVGLIAVWHIIDSRLGFGCVIAFVALALSCRDTIYAPAYSEEAFRKIRIGMSEQEVVALVGQPLGRDARPYVENWFYGEETAEPAATQRQGVLSRSVSFAPTPPETFCSLDVDRKGSAKYVNGRLLPLEVLSKCRTTTDVLRAFGVPNHRRVYKAVTHLIYSRPLGGGNYNLRCVELSDDGRVVAIESERYYD